jgi:radical SAM superfamily enzyme YgiQ (UPF0313 family)
MKVLLVYPRHPETFWSFRHALKFILRKSAFPPLGLLTVAAMLPGEWEKRLVDENVRPLKDRDIVWADMVLVSAMLVQEKGAQNIINRAHALGKTVVAGGPAFTARHDKYSGVDHFVLDEAEETLPLFLADLAAGHPKPLYSSPVRPDIARTPLPLWSLVNFRDYATMAVQFSRGCPFDCEFCDIVVMNGRVPRTRTPERMMAEFDALYDGGWRGPVFVVDDNFIGNKERVKDMLKQLIRWQTERKYPFRFLTEASLNLADDDELIGLMSAANFDKIFVGIETPCAESLKECGKTQNAARDTREAVRHLYRNGMQVMGGFIVGFDSDTKGIFQDQIRFIQQIGVVTAMIGILTALPKTRLHARLKKEGRLVGETSGENTDGHLNFKPVMGKKTLLEGYRSVFTALYSIKLYYQRIHTFIASYVPKVRARISFRDLLAFFRSTWEIGVFSKARFHYWYLVVKTILTKGKALPVAVEMAITGVHFEKEVKRIARMESRRQRADVSGAVLGGESA